MIDNGYELQDHWSESHIDLDYKGQRIITIYYSDKDWHYIGGVAMYVAQLFRRECGSRSWWIIPRDVDDDELTEPHGPYDDYVTAQTMLKLMSEETHS